MSGCGGTLLCLDYSLFDSSFVGPPGRNPIACRGFARTLPNHNNSTPTPAAFSNTFRMQENSAVHGCVPLTVRLTKPVPFVFSLRP